VVLLDILVLPKKNQTSEDWNEREYPEEPHIVR
jgi:hypothetical protein